MLEEKEYEEITISDICKRAGINRSTFYSHYDNIIEVVSEIENRLIDDFIQEFANKEKENDMSSSKTTPKTIDINSLLNTSTLLVYLDYVKKYQKLFVIYNKNGIFSHDEHNTKLKKNIFYPALRRSGIDENEIEMDYMFSFFLSGLNAIIQKWVSDKCTLAAERICSIIQKCTIERL